jgi:hypothetical protein
MDDMATKLIANALYQIRLLLSPYIGSENAAPVELRFAAHLAYALHNEALALATGTRFDVDAALKKVAAIDHTLGTQDGRRLRLAHSWGPETRGNASSAVK